MSFWHKVAVRLRLRKDIAKKEAPKDEGRRSQIVADFLTVDQYVQQPWNYGLLLDYADYHPVLRTVIEAIQREVSRTLRDKNVLVQPRFIKKCLDCGAESHTEVDECRNCQGKNLKDPNPNQKLWLRAFLKDPNRDDELKDIVHSILRFLLVVDDWYISVAQNPWRIYVEDSRLIHLCYDKYGRLGNGQWFCVVCWDSEKNQKTYDKKQATDFKFKCEFCGGGLRETCFVNVVGGRIQRRFHRDPELPGFMIHRNSSPRLPRVYGSPKAIAVLRQLRTVTAMDVNLFYTYTKGRIEKILVMLGIPQEEANKIAGLMQEQKLKLTYDPLTGSFTRVPTTFVMGAERATGVEVHDMMQSSEEMQSLEWWEKCAAVAGGVYGVQPIMQPGTEQTKTGYHQRMQVIVQKEAMEGYLEQIEEPFNETLLPVAGITDWIFKAGSVEARNELGDAQVWQAKVAAVVQAKQAGLDAKLTEEGEVKISTPEGWELPEPLVPSGTRGYIVEPPKPPSIPSPETGRPFSETKSVKGKDVIYEVRVKEEE